MQDVQYWEIVICSLGKIINMKEPGIICFLVFICVVLNWNKGMDFGLWTFVGLISLEASEVLFKVLAVDSFFHLVPASGAAAVQWVGVMMSPWESVLTGIWSIITCHFLWLLYVGAEWIIHDFFCWSNLGLLILAVGL